jgi:hypothetical protein
MAPPSSPRTPSGGDAFQGLKMAKPALMDVVRRAYELWEQAGKPEGRDQEFYLEAERELQEALDKNAPDEHE